MSDLCDKALEIIQKTHDGNDLAPTDLYLVECAVNGFLNDAGKEAFEGLHKSVAAGTYKQPWFHGIENLLIDDVGYIYWKGKVVEHYECPWAYSEAAKRAAKELAKRCRVLEERGEVPTNHNAIWTWPDWKRPDDNRKEEAAWLVRV